MKSFVKQNKKLKNVISEVSEVASYLWRKGWAEAGAGNISVNISQYLQAEPDVDSSLNVKLENTYPKLSNQYFYITGMGRRMRDVSGEPMKNTLIIKLNQTGDSYFIISENKQKKPSVIPTSELPTHLSIHQQLVDQGKNNNVILHTHVTELIALTHSPEINSKDELNQLIWSMHPETMTFIPNGVGFVPFALPGTIDIAEKTIAEFKSHSIVIWEKHGVFAIANEIVDAFDKIDMISKAAKIWFMCKNAGFDPKGLTQEQIDKLKKYYYPESNI